MQTGNNNNLIEYLKTVDVFNNLEVSTLQALADNTSSVMLNRDETLFKKGDAADAMFVVKSGMLAVFMPGNDGKEVEVGEIGTGSIAGEIQFLTGGKRTATICAKEDAELIKLYKTIFDTIQSDLSVFLQRINEIIQYRLRHSQLSVILPKLFGSLSSGEIKAIEKNAERVTITRGKTLFHQGEQTDAFYILLNDHLGVSIKDGAKKAVMVNQIYSGESVGEISLITDGIHSATVYAMRNSELVKFSKTAFHRFLKMYPELSTQIMQMIVRRLHRAQRATKRKKSCAIIAVAPVNPEAPMGEFTKRLITALSAQGSMLHVNSKSLDTFLETPGISQISEQDHNMIRVATWFNLQEEKYRFIICETDNSVSNWTKHCLSLAEHVVLIGSASSDSGLGEIESKLIYHEQKEQGVRYTLILLHPNGHNLPAGTKKWLEKRPISMHHHIRMDNNADFHRVARFISEREIGLALSGGGARGFAHIGAFRAFEESETPVDIIGGVSMGSLVGAFYAMGWSYETMVGMCNFSASDMIFDLTLPFSSILSGKKFVKALEDHFGDTQIEDLWLPYFCVSTNLTRAETKTHRTGPLWEALQASNAAPGIFPPVVLDKELHVDGCLLSNLPATEMRELCNGAVVGIDVTPPVDLAENTPYKKGLSGWRILWSKLNPFAKTITIPSIASILRRSGEIASIANRRQVIENSVDLYLRLPAEKYNVQDYKLAKQIIDDGYIYTKQEMAKNQLTGKL